ncbi:MULTISPECIES: methyltransferase domain-containing protein [unclassified Tolypothrix]|uniref:methyltransferase domain-containing protein n=1 Tax=unclassified Tolypothrix TaxID=2649714 RepID=UPI0005EAB5A2|nr:MULTISPECIES: methyltransferase domain-containing protein [unclassified Tolypothrix]BAY89956.1 trans-aconitate 2-methyltransferase [Microchaete diplosiphon NIES-3275]EKE96985.1 methyltransferase domain protein [Tolypothrix sp. PCC 7601]MBE9085190.1 methyltransferase domain-containing protein [Tolypothrix sp. LEGE 11397]UYD24188.1 methyltransferase domain-containing protein [Tolypothrix sp. PCC 7712]UYD33583.1 methyltransferase domain-containing protein [Tolypothrix sp. PCC 7601]
MPDKWNPEQYERFQAERSRPFYDLVDLVNPQENLRVLDLGCGTGKLTKYLHETLAAKETLGIDASEKMLSVASQFAGNGLRFEQGRIEDNPGEGKFDVVFSNAALQWLTEHETLFAKLRNKLQAGGQLAIQIPAMDDEPVHQLAVETAQEFSQELKGYVRRLEVLSPVDYAKILYKLGFVKQQVKLQIYGHLLPSREAVLEWYRGTLLTAYETQLDTQTYERFVARYQQKLFSILPDERPFFFPYKRILIWGLNP